MRAALRLLLLAAMLLAPLGRIGMAQASTGHCAEVPAATQHGGGHHRTQPQQAPRDDKGQAAIDCMIACAAMAPAPAAIVAPPADTIVLPGVPRLTSLTGILPEAETPPPRRA